MSKQFFILSSNEGSGGVVKVISTNNSHSINIQLENDFPGRKNCFIILSDGTKEEIGFMYKYSAAFEIKSTNSIDGIYITSGTPEQIILWSGNDKPTFEEEKKWNQAVLFYAQAISINIETPYAKANLAKSFYELGNYKLAIYWAEQTLSSSNVPDWSKQRANEILTLIKSNEKK